MPPKGEEEPKMQQKNYQQEILALIHSGLPQAELAEKLSDYHENDLADALAALTPDERQKLYAVLGVDTVAEIFSYLDDAEPYQREGCQRRFPHGLGRRRGRSGRPRGRG